MSIPKAKWMYFPKVKICTTEKKIIFISIEEFIQTIENDDDLTKLYGGPRSFLFLCSNNFSFSFELLNSIMPLSDILDLACALPRSKSSFTSGSMWLEFSKKTHSIQFQIPVCLYEGEFLLNYEFLFQSAFTTKMALQLFAKTLDIEINNSFFVDSRSEIFESDFANFLIALLNDKIFLVVQLSSKKIKKVKERINTIKEILESEISYNIRLVKVKDEIVRFLGDNSILDAENQALFELLIESLYKISNEIKNKISSYTSFYMEPIGKIFLDFTKQIAVYHRYTEILEEVMKSFQKHLEDPIFNTIANKFQSEPYFQFLSIDQYLHEPEQRLPRYRLLIQRVFDSTPWGHPDKILLMSVLEEFNNERIKNNDETLFNQTTLAKYPSDLKQYVKYLPLEEGQGYITNYKVLLDGQQSVAVLYSDCFRIFVVQSKVTKVFEYRNLRILSIEEDDIENDDSLTRQDDFDPSKECIIFVYNCKYRIKFSSRQDLNSFVLNTKEASYMVQLKNVKLLVGLFWNNKISNCTIKLQHHSMAELHGNIYVFGGIDEKGLISSSFVYYRISENKWYTYDKTYSTFPQPRKDAVMISVKEKIYLFGGYSENMEPFNDLWIFDGDGWSLINKSVQLAEGGFYSAIEYLNGRILFIGGDKKIQTLIFDTDKNQWKEICKKSEIPLMKYHNVTFCESSEIVLLFGGMSVSENEPVKDLFVLDFQTDSWIKNSTRLIGPLPSPRYGNLVMSLKSYIFIFGGIGSNSPFVFTKNYFHLIRNEGKFPSFISFAAACVTDNAIWVLGGATEDGTSNVFYKITILRG